MSSLQIELQTSEDDEKWQKLVLYYLARLKGLCDWRNSSRSTKTTKSRNPKKCSSNDLETRIIDNVTQKTRISKGDINDINCYMAAGYEEGKQQAVKIISRSLKYGVMTGILLKRGNCYRIAPEYLDEPVKKAPRRKDCSNMRHKLSVKCVKTNVRKKRKSIIKKTKGKKRKHVDHVEVNERKGVKRSFDYDSDENPPVYKKNKRTSDTNINPQISDTSCQSNSRSITPIDDRNKRDVKAKRPRSKIQKPINYVPPLKKPRTESQSKSPSHHTDEDQEKCARNNKVINKFRMPRPRRYSTVMSSMSSSSSCTCDEEKYQVNKRTRRK